MTVVRRTDRLETFIGRAGAAGSVVHRLDAVAEVAAVVLSLAPEAPSVALSSAARASIRGLAPALSAGGARIVAPGDREALGSANVGISVASAAVAETGSVLLVEPDPADRLVGMLPPVHAVLLDPSDIAPGLTEIAALLRAVAGEPSYASLVTGPSRTADIERVLTVGVQGPREMHILLVPGVRGA